MPNDNNFSKEYHQQISGNSVQRRDISELGPSYYMALLKRYPRELNYKCE